MALPKRRGRILGATGKGLKAVASLHPVGRIAVGALGMLGGGAKPRKKRRTRGMYLRKGRLFLGFSQKDVKNAMRRAFGGRRSKR